MVMFGGKRMGKECSEIDIVLGEIKEGVGKVEKWEWEKREEMGGVNGVIKEKEVEIDNVKREVGVGKEGMKEVEEGGEDR